jgi:TRAP-type C4-dicarboxylate transport system permease small subunit
MDIFTKITERSVKVAAIVAGVFLLLNMLLIVANVLYRIDGGVIIGVYELVEITIGVAAALAISYTGLKKGHVVVDMLLSRLSERPQAIVNRVYSIISFGFLALIAWGGLNVTIERFISGEVSTYFQIPLWPFRSIWLIGLLLFIAVIFRDIFKNSKKEGRA